MFLDNLDYDHSPLIVQIKNLAAELCLDRAVVLEILRDPPPSLLMMSAALPDEPTPRVSVPEVKPEETVMEETIVDAVELESKVKEPVHARQHRWFAQKRLKKVQVETLELVYRRSKRPTVSKYFSRLILQFMHWNKFFICNCEVICASYMSLNSLFYKPCFHLVNNFAVP